VSGWASAQELRWAPQAEQWKAFHSEAFHAAARGLQTALAQEFQETRTQPATDAARIIELRALGQLIPYPDCAADFLRAQLPSLSASAADRQWLCAHCWRAGHQGLVKKASQLLRTEMDSLFATQWADLQTQTDDFQRGSLQARALADQVLNPKYPMRIPIYAYPNSAYPNLLIQEDRFAGLRQRLCRRFGWLAGYLAREQAELLGQLRALALSDPADRVLHRVRPSQEAGEQRRREEAFLQARARLEDKLARSLARTAQWQGYFGAPQPPEAANVTNVNKKETSNAANAGKKKVAPAVNAGKGEAAVRQMKQLAGKGRNSGKK